MRLPEIDPAKGHVQVFDGHFRVYMRNPHEGATEIPYTPDTLPEAVTQVLLLVG